MQGEDPTTVKVLCFATLSYACSCVHLHARSADQGMPLVQDKLLRMTHNIRGERQVNINPS